MVHRRTLFFACLLATAASASGFATGVFHARRAGAATPAAHEATATADGPALDAAARAALVAEIKKELAKEMGLLPVSLLRDRRSSFVELYSYDKAGKTHYGTAGYLGHGYFITVKHAVVALPEDEGVEPSPITSVRILHKGEEIPAKVVDTGDASVEVHPGDWAIIKSRDLDLPALHIDSGFGFDFADPIFRLGNDYSRGIILSTGYIGQRTPNGLVTCLIDGHPGVSGGGVLNRQGDLVGIPIGRLEGDYRFSFLLPLRPEMFRKIPELSKPLTAAVAR
jgi:S1-C subfamily serine protease